VIGPGQKFLLRSGQPSLVWVWVWKISPKYQKNFNFFPSGQKKSNWVGSKSNQVKAGSASFLLRVKSMLSSGQGPAISTHSTLLDKCKLTNLKSRA